MSLQDKCTDLLSKHVSTYLARVSLITTRHILFDHHNFR